MIGMIGPGMSIGFSSIALPVLTSNSTSAIGSNYFYEHPKAATWFGKFFNFQIFILIIFLNKKIKKKFFFSHSLINNWNFFLIKF